MDLTDFEKRRLKKLQDAVNKYHIAREAHLIEGIKINKWADELFGENGSFKKFWEPIRKRESNK